MESVRRLLDVIFQQNKNRKKDARKISSECLFVGIQRKTKNFAKDLQHNKRWCLR